MQEFSFINCIWPVEWQLQAIIGLIWVLAIIVLCKAHKIKRKGQANIALLDAFKNVDALAAATKNIDWNENQYLACFGQYIQSIFSKDDEEKSAESEENENAEEKKEKKADNTKFFKDGVDLVEHLKAIYDAGCKRNRLEPQLLIQNTVSKVFAGADSLHTMISLFLVCGILGTLMGLAICISNFTIADSSNAGQAIIEGLNELLKVLRGAFAPSIWGVFFTIMFIAYHTLVINDKCISVFEEKLTKITINVWMPKLIPSDFQNSETAINRLKETAGKAVEINTGAETLVKNLKYSNGITEILKQTIEQIKQGLGALKDDHLNLSEINEALSAMKDGVEASRTSANALLDAKEDLAKAVSDPIMENLGKVATAVENMGEHLKNLSSPMERANADLQKLFYQLSTDFTNNSKDIADNSKNVVDQIVQRVDTLMQRKVGTDSVPVENQLKEVNNNLKKLHSSIGNSSDGGIGMFGKISLGLVVVLLVAGMSIQGMMLKKISDVKNDNLKITEQLNKAMAEQNKLLQDIRMIVRDSNRDGFGR